MYANRKEMEFKTMPADKFRGLIDHETHGRHEQVGRLHSLSSNEVHKDAARLISINIMNLLNT